MKVLFIQKRANKAGAQVCLERTVEALRDMSIDAQVILGEDAWLADRLRQKGVLCGIIPFPSFRAPLSQWLRIWPFARATDRILEKYGPFHIVHANDSWDALLSEWLALRWNIPWVVHLRTIPSHSHYYKYHCDKANAAIAVSPEVYGRVNKWRFNFLEFIPEGLKMDEFFDPCNNQDQFPETVGVIGHGGQLKGWDDLLDAFETVKKMGYLIPRRLVFFGHIDKKGRNRLQQKIPYELKASFEGHVDNMAERARKLGLVIAPSQKESFGRAMMEIIAAGVPIIASRTGVVPDVMGAGSPWTFSPGNPDDLASTWINLPFLWSKRLDFVCQWQKKLLDGFLLEGATRKLIKVYMQILSKKSL